MIYMDFVEGLPMTRQRHDSISVIFDRLVKFAYFILARSYISEIVKLYGTLGDIILDRGVNSPLIFGDACIRAWILDLV